jgi:hypothetical protein
LYIADYNRIRAINFATNIITTIAGGGVNDYSRTPQPAKDCDFRGFGLWGDGRGNIYMVASHANEFYYNILLYSTSAQTIELFAYSNDGAQKTNENDVPLLDLKTPHTIARTIAGDATRNYLYVSENRGISLLNAIEIIRKFDLNTNISTIFAGTFGQPPVGSTVVPVQYTDGALATTVKLSPRQLWVADDGTVFVSHNSIISAIDPVSQRITWVAGTWRDIGSNLLRATDDINNTLRIGGLAKLGKTFVGAVSGNTALNKLYVLDPNHDAVRVISPISAFLSSPSRRKLEEQEEQFLPEGNNGTELQTRSSSLRGSV